LVRFHEPPPFWGPKAKPKRKADEKKFEKIKKVVVELGRQSDDEEINT